MTEPVLLASQPTLAAQSLANQRVLITGAAGGLGSELAIQAASAGAEVILLDKDLPALEALHDRIETALGQQPGLYPLDLMGASPDDYLELAERLEHSLGGLDVLVHGAAQVGKPAPLQLYDPQTWLETVHINVNAAFLLTQAMLGLLRHSAGRIIFMSDRCGREGQSAMGAYAVSKWAVEGLMHTLAAEYSTHHPVSTCSVDTGPMRTALRRAAYAGEMADEVPDPEHAASAVVRLLNRQDKLDNGASYRVSIT